MPERHFKNYNKHQGAEKTITLQMPLQTLKNKKIELLTTGSYFKALIKQLAAIAPLFHCLLPQNHAVKKSQWQNSI